MALIVSFTCSKCGEKRQENESSHHPMCGACVKLEADAKKAKHLAERAKLTILERIAKLEEDAYDHRLMDHGRRDQLLF